MNVGFVGYISLRRDQFQPIDTPDQFYTILEDLTTLNNGEPLHFMQLKALTPDCQEPSVNAEPDEVAAHRSVIHYGDSLAPMMRYCNSAPGQGRLPWLIANPFDWSQVRYQLPTLDVVIVESTGNVGSSYGMSILIKRLYDLNPRLGVILMDCDLSAASVNSKIVRLGVPRSQIVLASYGVAPRGGYNQTVAIKHHIAYRQLPMSSGTDICYIGNDYDRRDSMRRFFRGPRFHWYGRCKKDFMDEVSELGCQWHGPCVATPEMSLEMTYHQHGVGLQISREQYYKINALTIRASEIIRSGCVLLVDKRMQIARPIAGDWGMVEDAEDAVTKANQLSASTDYHAQIFEFQKQAINYWLPREKHAEALWRAALALYGGAGLSNWRLNLYEDLCVAAEVTRYVRSS